MRLGVGTWRRVQLGEIRSVDGKRVDGSGLRLIATVSRRGVRCVDTLRSNMVESSVWRRQAENW